MNDDLLAAIAVIDTAVAARDGGLPEPVFELISRLTPMVNVDLLIRDTDSRVLMTWRADAYYGPGWHIPGGIVRFKERWERRIEAVAMAELGTCVTFDPKPLRISQPINQFRAIRGHFVSLLFDCQLTAPLDPRRQAFDGNVLHGQWAWQPQRPRDLIAVHAALYGDLLLDEPHSAVTPAFHSGGVSGLANGVSQRSPDIQTKLSAGQ
jgi:colanic acid biosynthesis protein WcaH